MKRVLLYCVLFAAVITLPAQGGQYYAGKGFLHTSTATALPPGALDISFFARGYVSVANDLGYTLSNGSSALGTAFGFMRHVELGFTQILYQDLNATLDEADKSAVVNQGGGTSVIPGDTFIRFKFSDYELGDNFRYGFAPALRYRVSKFHDIQFEPYESNAVEAELMALLSYFEKPLYPDDGYSVHLNIGAINHNDADSPPDASLSLNFLTSFVIPNPRFDYGVELYGSIFMVEPPIDVLSRENWMYITPMVRYKLFKGLQFTMGLDLLLLGGENTTVNESIPNIDDHPNYPAYRISGRIHFTPSTAFYVAPTFKKVDERGTGRERRQTLQSGPVVAAGAESGGGSTASGGGDMYSRQELFRWAIEERFGGKEAVDVDLNKIREERMRAEEQLKKLKKEMNDKK